jgi:hypothetical protein
MKTSPEFAKAVFEKAVLWLEEAGIEISAFWDDVPEWERTFPGVFTFRIDDNDALNMGVFLLDNGEIKGVAFDRGSL